MYWCFWNGISKFLDFRATKKNTRFSTKISKKYLKYFAHKMRRLNDLLIIEGTVERRRPREHSPKRCTDQVKLTGRGLLDSVHVTDDREAWKTTPLLFSRLPYCLEHHSVTNIPERVNGLRESIRCFNIFYKATSDRLWSHNVNVLTLRNKLKLIQDETVWIWIIYLIITASIHLEFINLTWVVKQFRREI